MPDDQKSLERAPPDAGATARRPRSVHARHCFVVMPHGRTGEEIRWYKGWYEVVIKPAAESAGYEPILAATEEQPGAINDEIRAHLAFDPMIVVDLGGTEPEDEPNPNVMYELGIRHALGLPLVMLAWQGQRLPFDVGNQRVIMEQRDLIDLETNRKKLAAFIHAAAEGRYYRPMEAVSRIATIEAASADLGPDSILRALVAEVRELRATVAATSASRQLRQPAPKVLTVKRVLRSRPKAVRSEILPHFLSAGGTTSAWSRLLQTPVSSEFAAQARAWDGDEWKAFVVRRLAEMQKEAPDLPVAPVTDETSAVAADAHRRAAPLSPDLVEGVAARLPAQPWPTGTHRRIAEELSVSPREVSDAIDELIRQGRFGLQADGVVLEGSALTPESSDGVNGT